MEFNQTEITASRAKKSESLSEVRSIEDDAHENTTNGTGDGDGHDP